MKVDATKLRVELARRNWKQKDLAERSGIERQNISTILKRGSCTVSTAGRISKALGLDPSEIILPEARN